MTENNSSRNDDPLDDLFAYDDRMDDVFETGLSNNGPSRNVRDQLNTNKPSGTGLGIDEEVTIVKKRAPVAKLDETRLLSEKGITKLRCSAKKKLKFRGKGHEFSDVQQLLSLYQLWLDDLYPRAKFADGLAIIEKLGHKSRIRMMRQRWIDEGKPKSVSTEVDDQPDERLRSRSNEPMADTGTGNGSADRNINDGQVTAAGEGGHDTDEQVQPSLAHSSFNERDGPEGDELDALLAESAGTGQAPSHSLGAERRRSPSLTTPTEGADDFSDEMEAMAGMEDVW